jgi:hypothetical protein
MYDSRSIAVNMDRHQHFQLHQHAIENKDIVGLDEEDVKSWNDGVHKYDNERQPMEWY